MRHLRALPTPPSDDDAPVPGTFEVAEGEEDDREWWECYTAYRWWL